MYVISASKKKQANGPNVGTHTSIAVKAEFDDNYADGEAFRIHYQLTDKNGQKYPFIETFYNTLKNERTAQFFEYLDGLGIECDDDGLPNVVGLRETVVLKKRVGYSRPVIVEREAITADEVVAGA